ncbi:putative secreted protein [Candidatus Phytoplasma asteris]|uniref:Secreted protein n=1 Tax=Candidatus Phytoplasma asteris TaxID=85620 RepID=A0ABZ2YF57_9MOLU
MKGAKQVGKTVLVGVTVIALRIVGSSFKYCCCNREFII